MVEALVAARGVLFGSAMCRIVLARALCVGAPWGRIGVIVIMHIGERVTGVDRTKANIQG